MDTGRLVEEGRGPGCEGVFTECGETGVLAWCLCAYVYECVCSMNAWVYVCMCLCECACVGGCLHMCVHVCVCSICTHVCMCACMCAPRAHAHMQYVHV